VFFVTYVMCMFVCMHLYIEAVHGCVHACPESVRKILLTTDNISAYTESAIQVVAWNLVAN